MVFAAATTTYVLVMMFSTGNGLALATIPGYATKVQCDAAGTQYVNGSGSRSYVCTTGPKVTAG